MGPQVAASYGRLEMCIRLVEAGSPWPSGKGAKAGGGDVVALLAGSKLCRQRQLKVGMHGFAAGGMGHRSAAESAAPHLA